VIFFAPIIRSLWKRSQNRNHANVNKKSEKNYFKNYYTKPEKENLISKDRTKMTSESAYRGRPQRRSVAKKKVSYKEEPIVDGKYCIILNLV